MLSQDLCLKKQDLEIAYLIMLKIEVQITHGFKQKTYWKTEK